MSIFEDSVKAFNVPLVNFGQAEGIQVCLSGIDCPTDTSIPFLFGQSLPIDLTESELGYTEDVDYIYQIDVRYPSHRGNMPVYKIVDMLRQVFKVNSVHTWGIACSTVTEFNISPVSTDDGWAVCFISLTATGTTLQI